LFSKRKVIMSSKQEMRVKFFLLIYEFWIFEWFFSYTKFLSGWGMNFFSNVCIFNSKCFFSYIKLLSVPYSLLFHNFLGDRKHKQNPPKSKFRISGMLLLRHTLYFCLSPTYFYFMTFKKMKIKIFWILLFFLDS